MTHFRYLPGRPSHDAPSPSQSAGLLTDEDLGLPPLAANGRAREKISPPQEPAGLPEPPGEPVEANGAMVEAAPQVRQQKSVSNRETRSDLLLAEWLKRKLPPRDFLLGDVFCTTSRWLLYGPTGVGKTLFSVEMAGAIAAGAAFLNWEGRRASRVMYLDGELPAETFKERMKLVAEQYGEDLSFYGYNRDDLTADDLPPLNTEAGHKWLLAEINKVKPDAIFFDSIMCLLSGVMSDEESWTPLKPLIRQLSNKRIGQAWVHHTGHDASKGYGTKTREWELDTVLSLMPAEDGNEGIAMEFKKARLRTPENKDQFASRIIRRAPEGWTSDGVPIVTAKGAHESNEVDQLKIAILAAYDRLADSIVASPGFDGKPVKKVNVGNLRDEVRDRGFLDTKETGGLTDSSRTNFRRAKSALITGKRLIEDKGQIWR